MSGSKFVYVTYIRITPENLWQALTTPQIIQQYRFGMSVESEWKVSSPWSMYADGSLMDSGEILESVSQKRLVLSWRSEWKPEFKCLSSQARRVTNEEEFINSMDRCFPYEMEIMC